MMYISIAWITGMYCQQYFYFLLIVGYKMLSKENTIKFTLTFYRYNAHRGLRIICQLRVSLKMNCASYTSVYFSSILGTTLKSTQSCRNPTYIQRSDTVPMELVISPLSIKHLNPNLNSEVLLSTYTIRILVVK